MEDSSYIQQMRPNLRSTLVVEIISTIKQVDEAHRRKPMDLPGRGVSYDPQLMLANKSPSYPRHNTPPSTTRVEDVHTSTTDNTNVSSTTEARYTSRSPTHSTKAGDHIANTTLYHSCFDTDTDDALAAEKVTPTLPVQVQAALRTIEKTKRLPISEPLQLDNELVYKSGIPASKNDRYPLSYKDPERGRKVWVELAQRPGPAPGPAKMKERGEEREKEEIPSDCQSEALGLAANSLTKRSTKLLRTDSSERR